MTNIAPTAPVRLGRDTVVHLPCDLSLRHLTVDQDYWDHANRQAKLFDGRIMSIFEYISTWTWWERHPVGDELAHLLSGEVELLLEDDDGGRHEEIKLSPGESALIPAGAWHSIRLTAPSCILFVTPTPARTEHRPA